MIDPDALPSPEDIEKLREVVSEARDRRGHVDVVRLWRHEAMRMDDALRLCAELIRQLTALREDVHTQWSVCAECNTVEDIDRRLDAILKGTPR